MNIKDKRVQFQYSTFNTNKGGIETYLYNAAMEFNNLGFQAEILCSNGREVPGIRLIKHPDFSFRAPFSVFNPSYRVSKLSGFLRNMETRPDVIFSRNCFYSYASSKVFKGKVPIIYLMATAFPLFLSHSCKNKSVARRLALKSVCIPQYRRIESNAIKMCDAVVVPSKIFARQISDYYGFPVERVFAIPRGVDLKKFKPRRRDRSLLKELRIPESAKIVLTVCRLSPEKDLSSLIKAFHKLQRKDKCLVVVGEGPEMAGLKQLCSRLNMRKDVVFTGHRTDIERFYSIADVFVLSSIYEGFSLVTLEAMASGVPCIGTRSNYPEIVTAFEELIAEGKTGYLYSPSSEELVLFLDRMLSDDNLARKMAKRARKLCENDYSWKKHVSRLLNLEALSWG